MDLNHEEVLLKFEVPGEFLLKELQEMYDNSSKLDSCDVKIMCRDRHTINTHSALLAVVSPYLKILLSESWSPHQCASIILPDFKYVSSYVALEIVVEIIVFFLLFCSGRDVQNLIKFLYTGRASLNETEFEVFQQLIYELQIRTEEETAIILEQIHRNDKETSEHDKEVFATVENVRSEVTVPYFYLQTAEQNNETKAIDSIITLELSPNMKDVSIEVPTATDIITTDYLCPICSVSFTCPSQLKNHKNIHELQYEVDLILDDDSVVKKRPTLSCELCPSAAFSSQSKLNDHMLKHTGERPFKCSYCDKSYPVKGKHFPKRTRNPYFVNTCLFNLATLTAHLRLHANEKPHQCERCGKAFLIRSLLEQHLRTHTNERPFACDVRILNFFQCTMK